MEALEENGFKDCQDRLKLIDALLNLLELRLLEIEIRVSQIETSLRSSQL